MTMLWKLLVLALVGYAIHMHHKLLYLADAAYSGDTPDRSLHGTVWGGDAISSMDRAMYGVLVLAGIALCGDLIRLVREQSRAQPPSEPPPAGALEQTPPEQTPPSPAG